MGTDGTDYTPTPIDAKAADDALRFTARQQGVFGGGGRPLKVEDRGGLDPSRTYHFTQGSDLKIYGEGDQPPDGPQRPVTIKLQTLDGVPLVTTTVLTSEPNYDDPAAGPQWRISKGLSVSSNYELSTDQGKGFKSVLSNEQQLNKYIPKNYVEAFRGSFNDAQNKGLIFRFAEPPAAGTESGLAWKGLSDPAITKGWWDGLPSLSLVWGPGLRWNGFRFERSYGWGCAALGTSGLVAGLIVLAAALGLCGGATGQETHNTAGVTAPQLSPITATFSRPNTTYQVQLTASDDQAFQFTWSNTNSCGVFPYDPATGARAIGVRLSAIWHHPDASGGSNCPSELVHPGTISVEATDGHYTCTAAYSSGSAPGISPPGNCSGKGAAVAQPVSPTPSAPWPGIGATAILLAGLGIWIWRGGLGGPRGGAMVADPCEKERAWVAELRANIAAMEQELSQSVSRGDTYLPPNLVGSLALDRDLLQKAEAMLARCLGFDVPDPYAPPAVSGPVTVPEDDYLRHILDGIELPLPQPVKADERESDQTSRSSVEPPPAGPFMQPLPEGPQGPGAAQVPGTPQSPVGPQNQPPPGPSGPVVPPPPQQTTHDEHPHAHCGPQVDQIFVEALNRTLERLRTIFGPEPDQATGVEFMVRNGWNLDFWVDPPATCAGPHCPATITLCGLCHQHHILSDFMYGFVAGYFGLAEAHVNMGGQAFQVYKMVMDWTFTPIDPAHYTEAQPAYGSGVRLGHVLTMTAEERMVTIADLCSSRTGEHLGAVAIRTDCPPAPCIATQASKDFSIMPWSWDVPVLTTPKQAQAIKGTAK